MIEGTLESVNLAGIHPAALSPTPNVPGSTSIHRDPYTISDDGHLVGSDGFVVPKDFSEFHDRYPKYVRGFVRRRIKSDRINLTECLDYEQELTLFLMTLPEESECRKSGYNGLERGCTDRIQTFQPNRTYGANSSRFFAYINNILYNAYLKIIRKNSSNPALRYNNTILGPSDYATNSQSDAVNHGVTDESVLFSISERYKSLPDIEAIMETSLLVQEFVVYVQTNDPGMIPIMDAIVSHDTYVEAQVYLGLNEKSFTRARNRIISLYMTFEQGHAPKLQRKVYRDRVAKLPSASVAPCDVHEFAVAV